MKHGQILGGVVTTPDLAASITDYRDRLGLELVEQGTLDRSLARSWGCPASGLSPFATLQPRSGAACFIRLIEQPLPPAFKPTTTFGWASYEISVQDVFGWPERLRGSGFEIVGPPREIPGMPYFVAMQMLGRGREMIYLNEVRMNSPASDLPKARSPVDQIFICILATPGRAETVAWYQNKLGLDAAETYTIPYSMINNAFGLPADTLTSLTMVQNGRMPIVEVDDYPPQARERPHDNGRLPPGNALVSLAVDDLDALELEWITPPVVQAGTIYDGRRAATVVGSAGELLELVELRV